MLCALDVQTLGLALNIYKISITFPSFLLKKCNDFLNRGESLRKSASKPRMRLTNILAEFEEEILVYCKHLSDFLSNQGS